MEEGTGDRGSKEGGSRGAKAQTPPCRRGGKRQERQEARESGVETEAEDKEGEEEEGDREGETPRGAPVQVTCVGGDVPPPGKMRTSQDSPLNVRTFCCRESMDTSRITTMGRTCTG